MASVQVCQASFNTYHFELHVPASGKPRRVGVQVWASEPQQQQSQVRCEQESSLSRRSLATLGVNLIYLSITPKVSADTGAPGPFSKYIKRKKLDPLDTYVPPVLLSKFQFQDLETKLQSDKPEYADSRSFLRTGPASSLRSNLRAVAQYASEGADEGKNALEAVRECIVSLEDLDSLLLRASRNDSSATILKMKQKIDSAVAALDKLLTTVPVAILEKSKAIAASYREETTSLSTASDQAEADTKLLESLL